MSYQATVFNVMIASPGDVSIERNIVREVVHEWNAVNALARKTVLLPLGWETHSTPLFGDRPQATINRQILDHSDLLIAAFWTRLGTPTGKAASGTVEEIEGHIAAGKPALLYFSSAPVVPDSLDPDQYQALKKFKSECQERGLYQPYESAAVFQSKVRNHLDMTLNDHPYFAESRASVFELDLADQSSSPKVPSLTREAQELLLEAVAGGGDIMVLAWMGGSTVQANQKNFVEQNNPRSRAIWEGAVQELIDNDFLQGVGYKNEVFRVTRKGFDAADLLKT